MYINRYILLFIVILIIIVYLSIRQLVQRFYFEPSDKILSTEFFIEHIDNHQALVRKHLGNRRCLLISHGNAGNITYRSTLFRQLKNYPGDIYCYEYPSFGNLSGKLNIKGCVDQHLFWLNYLSDKYLEIDLWGESIGGGIMAETIKTLDVKKNTDKKILNQIGTIHFQSTFSSLKTLIPHISGFLSFFYRIFALNDLNTIKNLQHPNFQKLKIIQYHSPQDEIIPFTEALGIKNICQKLALNYQFIEISGDHNNPNIIFNNLYQ